MTINKCSREAYVERNHLCGNTLRDNIRIIDARRKVVTVTDTEDNISQNRLRAFEMSIIGCTG